LKLKKNEGIPPYPDNPILIARRYIALDYLAERECVQIFIMRVIDHVLGQSSEALETKEREIRQLKEENKGLKEQIIEVCQNAPL
jgi:hypothetical protein